MRNKFTELIKRGVAAFEYTPIAPEIPEQDIICRTYNNIWSIPSDTHMHIDKTTGNRYITGHMVGIQDKWNKFICSSHWGGVNFKNTGYWSLCDFLQFNKLKGVYSLLNGDNVFLVISIDEKIQDLTAIPECPTCCTTTESKIPNNLAVLVTNGDIMKIKECYHNKQSLYDVCDALNENIYIKGDTWTVVDNHVMCPIGNKTFIL